MFKFENIEELKEYDNKRVVISIVFEDGKPREFFGKLKVIDNNFEKLLILENNSKVYKSVEGWLSDFVIQILRPSPFVMLMNYTKFEKGKFEKEVELDDQFRIDNFRIITS